MLGNTIHGIAHVKPVIRSTTSSTAMGPACPKFSGDTPSPSPGVQHGPIRTVFRNVVAWLGYGSWLKKQDQAERLVAEGKTNGLQDLLKQAGSRLSTGHPLIDALASKTELDEALVKRLFEKTTQAIKTTSALTMNQTSIYKLSHDSLPRLIHLLRAPQVLERALDVIHHTDSMYSKSNIAEKLAAVSFCTIPGYMDTLLALLEAAPIHHTMLPIGPLGSYHTRDISEKRWPRFAELIDILAKNSPEALKPSTSVHRLFLFLKQPSSETEWHQTMDTMLDTAKGGGDIFKLLNNSMLEWAARQKEAINQEWIDDFLKDLSENYTTTSEYWHYPEMQNILKSTRHLKTVVLYHQMTHHDPDAWISFLPQLMLNLPPKSINDFMRHLEYKMERFSPGKGHHPNEAEMLMMLRHPKDPRREEAGQIVSTLTAIYRYLSHSIINVPDRLTKIWSDAGFLTNSFRLWRYDSQGGDKSLLAQYGFKRLLPRPTDAVYGPGYVLAKSMNPQAPLQEGTLIEFRRAYLLVSNPEHGTLIIRNSSREFGRDTMAHPAYYSKKPLTSLDLKTFDIKQNLAPWPPFSYGPFYLAENEEPPAPHANLFMSLLDPRLYPTRVQPSHGGKHVEKQVINKAVAPIETLMKELLKVKEDYRRWKFDTGAFKDKQFRGQESPGFKATIDFVGRWSDMYELGVEDKPPPELGFVHPDYPPWETYPYTDAQGTEQRTYKLTPAHVDELGKYAKGELAGEALEKSDWFRFLKTGIQKKAELVLLTAESDNTKQRS